MEEESLIEIPDDTEQEFHILAEELSKVNFFIVRYFDFSFIGTYRTKDKVTEILLGDEEKNKHFWPSVYEVTKSELQNTLDEFGKVYCPELGAEYINILELLRDLKVFSLASLIE